MRTLVFISTLVGILTTAGAYAETPDELALKRIQEVAPPQIQTTIVSIPLMPQSPTDAAKLLQDGYDPREVVWLTSKVEGRCYAVYAEHYHEAKTTKGSDGSEFAVDNITLISEIAGIEGIKDCPNTSFCARTEKEYNMGCRKSCVYAKAAYHGIVWSTERACIW